MTITNWAVSLMSLVTSSGKPQLSNFFAYFLTWLSEPRLVSSRLVIVARGKFSSTKHSLFFRTNFLRISHMYMFPMSMNVCLNAYKNNHANGDEKYKVGYSKK
jgi:hypothetical protein